MFARTAAEVRHKEPAGTSAISGATDCIWHSDHHWVQAALALLESFRGTDRDAAFTRAGIGRVFLLLLNNSQLRIELV